MPGYQDLLHADLSLLHTAAADWKQVPKDLAGAGGVADSFEGNVAKGLSASDWSGQAADAARPVLARIREQLAAAGDEAHDVAMLLDDALRRFSAAQNTLRSVDQQVHDPGSSVTFDDDHRIVLRDPQAAAQDPDAARYADAAVAELNRSVQQALRDATDADEALCWALSQGPNGSDPGFDSDAYGSITTAERGREHSLRDAASAARLARADGKLNDAQVTELDHLLAEHHDDPVFGAEFATRVGPEGTLDFWARVNDPNVRRIDDPAALTQLQRDLSLTLASATRFPSPGMKRWESRMTDLGDEAIGDNRGSSPMGFQVMSSLMRVGTYDTSFLRTYGNALMTTDKSMATTPSGGWQSVPDVSHLNHLGGSQTDPVEGYMDALNHNPAAATGFFNTGDHLSYCTQVRHWSDQGSGYTALGHALTAGATGRPYGVALSTDFPRHTQAETHLMNSIVHEYAQNTGDIPSGLARSLGRMSGEYMPDFQNALSDVPGPTAGRLFLGDPGRWAHFDPVDATRFLYSLGQTPDGYAAVSLAQTRYSADAIAYHLRHPQAVQLPMTATVSEISRQGAAIQSIINTGRQDAAVQHARGGDSSFDKAMGYGLDWAKAGVGVASGSVAETLTEDPLVGGMVDKGVETAGGEAIDLLTSGLSPNSADSATYQSGTVYQHAMDRYRAAMAHAVQRSHLAPRSGISQDQVDDSMGTGFSWGEDGASTLVKHCVPDAGSTG